MADDPYVKRYPSPDGRHVVITADNEVKMSHWISSPVLVDAAGATLLDFGWSWSADQITWTDGDHVHLAMRHYPGDRSADVTLDVAARTVTNHADGSVMLFAEFRRWLEPA
jgi:hypothetical protein